MTEPNAPSLRWWDLAVVLLAVVMGTFGVVEALAGDPAWASSQPLAARLTLVFTPLLAMLVLHVTMGRAAIRRGLADVPPTRASYTFLVLMLFILCAGVAVVPMFAVLQTIAYPIVWTVADRYRDGVIWSAAIALSVALGFIAALGSIDLHTALTSAAGTAFLSFVFAVFMGTWITRIALQGERYRDLAEELRSSQAEVAALSREAGAANERERLSRDLHDTLTQTLTGLVMLTEQAERALDSGDTALGRERLGRVNAAARDAVVEARALVATTQPLGDGGLEAAIERLATRFATDTGLVVEKALEPVALDRERQVVLLRAAQEGLANARRHAHAASVRVTLAPTPGGGATLRVDDDGVGPVHTTSNAGFGLSGLGDRVRTVGGEVRFGPRGGGGAVLEVRVDPPGEES